MTENNEFQSLLMVEGITPMDRDYISYVIHRHPELITTLKNIRNDKNEQLFNEKQIVKFLGNCSSAIMENPEAANQKLKKEANCIKSADNPMFEAVMAIEENLPGYALRNIESKERVKLLFGAFKAKIRPGDVRAIIDEHPFVVRQLLDAKDITEKEKLFTYKDVAMILGNYKDYIKQNPEGIIGRLHNQKTIENLSKASNKGMEFIMDGPFPDERKPNKRFSPFFKKTLGK